MIHSRADDAMLQLALKLGLPLPRHQVHSNLRFYEQDESVYALANAQCAGISLGFDNSNVQLLSDHAVLIGSCSIAKRKRLFDVQRYGCVPQSIQVELDLTSLPCDVQVPVEWLLLEEPKPEPHKRQRK